MQIIIDIPNVPIKDYKDLYYKIYNMAASEGLFDDKVKSQHALALKAVLDVLEGVVNGTPLPKGHGSLIDADAFERRCMFDSNIEDMQDVIYALRDYKPIIEADKEEEDGNDD